MRGEAGTSDEWIDKIVAAVDKICEQKAFCVIDGVGFPSVGSVIGVSNAEVGYFLNSLSFVVS